MPNEESVTHSPGRQGCEIRNWPNLAVRSHCADASAIWDKLPHASDSLSGNQGATFGSPRFLLGLPHSPSNSARSASRPRSVSVRRPVAFLKRRPLTIRAVTVSLMTPARCQSVPLPPAEQKNAFLHSERYGGVWCRRLGDQPLTLFPARQERDKFASVRNSRANASPREPRPPLLIFAGRDS
jgi:hypothetical protein